MLGLLTYTHAIKTQTRRNFAQLKRVYAFAYTPDKINPRLRGGYPYLSKCTDIVILQGFIFCASIIKYALILYSMMFVWLCAQQTRLFLLSLTSAFISLSQ